MDYCASRGDDGVIQDEIADVQHLDADDGVGNEDNGVSLLESSDPGDICTDLLLNEDAKMDSPEQFKDWCMNDQHYSETDCDSALVMLGAHPWTQENINQVCSKFAP